MYVPDCPLSPIVPRGVIIYLYICFIEIIFLRFPIISHYGIKKYSIIENGILLLLLFVSGILTLLILSKNEIKEYTKAAVILWITYLLLDKVIDFRLMIHSMIGSEANILGVNFLSQDIWFYHYIGCLFGTIGAGGISLYKQFIR